MRIPDEDEWLHKGYMHFSICSEQQPAKGVQVFVTQHSHLASGKLQYHNKT